MAGLSKNDLIDRWKTQEGKVRRDTIMKCLLAGTSLDKLQCVEKVGDYYDLRGITFEHKTTFEKVTLKNINFTYADLDYPLVIDCKIENVIFDDTDCTEFLQYSSMFKDCSFIKTNLRGSGFGTQGTKYNNCLFNKANFKDASFFTGIFTDCVFSDCKLDGVDFGSSHFINVRFTGKLDDVWFRGKSPSEEYWEEDKKLGHGLNPMLVDFSGSELWDVTFSDNCDLSKVVLPKDDNHILVKNWPEVLETLDGIIDSEFADENCRKEVHCFINVEKIHSKTQSMMILNIKNIQSNAEARIKEKSIEFTSKLILLIDQINKKLL